MCGRFTLNEEIDNLLEEFDFSLVGDYTPRYKNCAFSKHFNSHKQWWEKGWRVYSKGVSPKMEFRY